MKSFSAALVTGTLALALCTLPAIALADSSRLVAQVQTSDSIADPSATDSAGYAEQTLFLAVEIINLVLVFVAIMLLALVIGRYGASELSVIFSFFMLSTALLGACRLFILLSDNGVLRLSEETMATGWHVVFYLAMITFILGAGKLVHLAKTGESGSSVSSMIVWAAFCGLVTLATFVAAPTMDVWYVALTGGTFFETFGVIHFLAFLLAGIAAFYVFQRTKAGTITTVLATPLLWAIGLLSLQHFWELLTESWKVFVIPSSLIEQIELVFVLPAYFLFAFAYYRLWKLATRVA